MDAAASLDVALEVVVLERVARRGVSIASTRSMFPSLLAQPFEGEEDEDVRFGIVGAVNAFEARRCKEDATVSVEWDSGYRGTQQEVSGGLMHLVNGQDEDEEEDL